MKPSARTNAARQVWAHVAGYCDMAAGSRAIGVAHEPGSVLAPLLPGHRRALKALAAELRARAAGSKGPLRG